MIEPYYQHHGNLLYLGDCRKVMPDLEPDSISAVVTDPPYDLISGKGRGFMGKAWDGTGVAFQPETWAAVLKLMKPGAHLLAFGGTRTYHRMACAIEDAGFEIRDSIACFGWSFSALEWVYGSGFPKSLDISKSIDKAAGAEREVVGQKVYADGTTGHWGLSDKFAQDAYTKALVSGTPKVESLPATDAARQWAGWGTALKPSHESIVLARKPLAGATVAENVLAWGMGGLNVDKCRVSIMSDDPNHRAPSVSFDHAGGPVFKGALGGRPDANLSPAGRFPPNLALCHHPLCRPCGERRVKTDSHLWSAKPGEEKFPGIYSDGMTETGIVRGHADADRCEIVQVWECVDGCPIKALDAQSGERKSGEHPAVRSGIGYGSGARGTNGERIVMDNGTVSRFFPTFAWTPADFIPLFYCPKASKSDRGHNNTHVSVKPQALVRWLCRLITPPGGTILDPFAGSGTTWIAAEPEGFKVVLIEDDPDHVEIIRRRWDAIQDETPLFRGL